MLVIWGSSPEIKKVLIRSWINFSQWVGVEELWVREGRVGRVGSRREIFLLSHEMPLLIWWAATAYLVSCRCLFGELPLLICELLLLICELQLLICELLLLISLTVKIMLTQPGCAEQNKYVVMAITFRFPSLLLLFTAARWSMAWNHLMIYNISKFPVYDKLKHLKQDYYF